MARASTFVERFHRLWGLWMRLTSTTNAWEQIFEIRNFEVGKTLFWGKFSNHCGFYIYTSVTTITVPIYATQKLVF